MLRRVIPLLVASAIAIASLTWEPSVAVAQCKPRVDTDENVEPGRVDAILGCLDDPTPTPNSAGNTTTTKSEKCYNARGKPVACWFGSAAWDPERQAWCSPGSPPPDDHVWDSHRDSNGNPIGAFYLCNYLIEEPWDIWIWYPTVPDTPPKPGADAEGAVRTAIATLQLHPPTVGVGAYVYPKYEKWGLGWWVGAPMWLWVDTNDPLQWGTHTITAALGTDSITATITATQVTYTTGDDTPPTICKTPGTPRPWKKDDPLDRHSPTNCEHTYWHTNKLGDVNSRYTVTATVTWNITWTATDGQSGHFSINMTSTDNPTIHVGELYTVRVPDPTPTGPR